MKNNQLTVVAAVLAAVFVVLNFTMEDNGTLFLILAVVSALAAVYFYSKRK